MNQTPRVPLSAVRPGRRGLLAAGAGTAALALTGCTLNNPFTTDKRPAAEATADLAPDVALAVTAVGALLEAQSRAQGAVAAFPALARRLAPWVALHQAHLDALRDAVPAGVDPSPTAPATAPPPGRKVALAQQKALEVDLHDQLVGLALRAESGPFARLLGTMAAAISQQLRAAPLPGATP